MQTIEEIESDLASIEAKILDIDSRIKHYSDNIDYYKTQVRFISNLTLPLFEDKARLLDRKEFLEEKLFHRKTFLEIKALKEKIGDLERKMDNKVILWTIPNEQTKNI